MTQWNIFWAVEEADNSKRWGKPAECYIPITAILLWSRRYHRVNDEGSYSDEPHEA